MEIQNGRNFLVLSLICNQTRYIHKWVFKYMYVLKQAESIIDYLEDLKLISTQNQDNVQKRNRVNIPKPEGGSRCL